MFDSDVEHVLIGLNLDQLGLQILNLGFSFYTCIFTNRRIEVIIVLLLSLSLLAKALSQHVLISRNLIMSIRYLVKTPILTR